MPETTLAPVSPAELLRIHLNANMNKDIVPEGAIVGGASDDEQQGGCVSLMDAGAGKEELYAPLIWPRVQLRCMGRTLDRVDRIGRHVYELLNDQGRIVVTDSEDQNWLIHQIYISGAPSHHWDSAETVESLLYATVGVSTIPVP